MRQGEERQADFIDIVCWRSTAEFVCKYFRKGMMVVAEGSIQTRNYEDKNGNRRKAVEIVAHTVHFAEPKRKDREQNIDLPIPSDAQGVPHSQGDAGDFVEIDADNDPPL